MKRWADNGVLSSYDAKTGALIISSDGQMNNVDHRDDFPLDGTKVPLNIIRRVAAVVFGVFGVWSLVTAIRG